MNEAIFRKKSIERIKSPENLDAYIRVTSPGMWLLLASVLIILIGACIWGIFGNIESTAECQVHVQDGRITCTVDGASAADVEAGQTVRGDMFTGQISHVTVIAGNAVCEVDSDTVPADGTYPAVVITADIRPISFILN